MDEDTQTMWDDPGRMAVDPARTSRRRLTRRGRRVLGVLVVLVVSGLMVGMGLVGWYLDRFVIAHVEIADVAAYEASLTTLTTPGDSAFATDGPDDVDPAPAVEEAIVTDAGYESSGVAITIEEVVVGEGTDTVTYFVADIVLDDASDLRTAFAGNAFGTNITEDTSDIAGSVGAILAINGDYYGFRDSGIVIRNGVAYRDEPARTGLAMYADGTMAIYSEADTSADELVAQGVVHTWSFGPALVDGGELVDGIEQVEVDGYWGKRSMQGENPRTAIGMIDPLHYVFVVVDGRAEGYSTGTTLPELAAIMQGLGATVAYNLDGGGSATLYFDGEVVNYPVGTGEERGTSDIIYVVDG